MSLHYHLTLVTPLEIAALHNVIGAAADSDCKTTAYRWLCNARAGLYDEWTELPDGHHLKEAYRDEVWQWNDEDIATPRSDNPTEPGSFARPTEEGLTDAN